MGSTALLAPVGGVPFSSGAVQDDQGRFTAEVHSVVVSGDPDNPLGGLSFWYMIDNINDGITDARPVVGLGVPLEPPAVGSVYADQGDSGSAADVAGLTPAGSSVSFVWLSDAILAGTSSSWVVIHTAYTSYREGVVGVADGTVEDIAALVPVPEPTTYAGLFALGLAGFAAYRRFRA